MKNKLLLISGSPSLTHLLFHGIINLKEPLYYIMKLLSLKAIPLIPKLVHFARNVSIGPPILISGM